jgi:hypothetical protein
MTTDGSITSGRHTTAEMNDAITAAEQALAEAERSLDAAEGRTALLDATMAALRLRARAAGIPVSAAAVVQKDAFSPTRVVHETVGYYSEEHLPPSTSLRAWKRALKSGVPCARITNQRVILVADWLAYVASLAKPPPSNVRSIVSGSTSPRRRRMGKRDCLAPSK